MTRVIKNKYYHSNCHLGLNEDVNHISYVSLSASSLTVTRQCDLRQPRIPLCILSDVCFDPLSPQNQTDPILNVQRCGNNTLSWFSSPSILLFSCFSSDDVLSFHLPWSGTVSPDRQSRGGNSRLRPVSDVLLMRAPWMSSFWRCLTLIAGWIFPKVEN